MRIGFCSDDFVQWGDHLAPGGCAYYRLLLPKNAAYGPTSAFGPPAFASQLGFGVRDRKDSARFGFDGVMMKQMMHRWVPQQMRIAKKLGQTLVVDIDDHYDGLHDANRAKQATDPERNRIRNRQIHNDVIHEADIVTVSTPFLQGYYTGRGLDVRLIRNGINAEHFLRHKHTAARKPVIGWVGAVGWRSNDLEPLREWLPDFLEQHDLTFHHSGDDPDSASFADITGIPEARITTSPMRPISTYPELFTFDIGLVPLSMIDFNIAKSNIKGLEYAASNIPFVATPTPEYARLAGMGVGRLADTPEQWVHHLTELLDYGVRKKEAAVQRTLVREQHSIQQTAAQWHGLFREIAAEPAHVPSVRVPYVDAE